MADESEYLCKDCKHSFMKLSDKIFTLGGKVGVTKYSYRCRKSFVEQEIKYDPVLGQEKIKPEYQSCIWSRRKDSECGPDAKYWRPKRKKDLFKMLTKEHTE